MVTAKVDTYDDEGKVTTSTQQLFVTAGDLHDHLYHFKSFLQGAGFNYVDNVFVIKNDGNEVGEE